MRKTALILLALVMWIVPSSAQTLSERQLNILDDINTAIETTLGQSTFSIEGIQTIEQDISAGGVDLEQTLIQEMIGDYINDSDSAQSAYSMIIQVIEQKSNDQTFDIALTQEMLINPDGIYIRFSDISPAMIESLYPDDWEVFEDAVEDYEGLATLNAENFMELLDVQQTTLPFAGFTDAIVLVEELQGIEIDEQQMSVYQTILDVELLFTDEYMEEVMGLFNFDALGFGDAVFDFEVGDYGLVRYIFYIGQDDGLLHRAESFVDMELILDASELGVGEIVILQSVEQTFDYFNFGEAIKLPTP